MKKKLTIIFNFLLFFIILIPIIRDSIQGYKKYNSTIEYYNSYIKKIETIAVSINTTYQNEVIRKYIDIDDNKVISKLEDSISKSIEESRDKRIFDFVGNLYLKKNNEDLIRISFDFNNNSNIIWFRVHIQDEQYGVYYKYVDDDMYWHDLLIDYLELHDN